MKQYGKVLTYDGYVGNIIDSTGIKYIFTTKDLKDKKIVEGDFVSFNVEIFETVETKEFTNLRAEITIYVKGGHLDENKGCQTPRGK
jgi:hypothetical protein